jgi:lipoprotein-anchoring transpeptidase ErfK/SrfK
MDAQEVDNKFELRDVPWVEYFEAGYAIHAAFWHEGYGRPRSHGCVNVSPIDARRVFMWTDPKLPADWHGVYAGDTTGEGTIVNIHP